MRARGLILLSTCFIRHTYYTTDLQGHRWYDLADHITFSPMTASRYLLQMLQQPPASMKQPQSKANSNCAQKPFAQEPLSLNDPDTSISQIALSIQLTRYPQAGVIGV